VKVPKVRIYIRIRHTNGTDAFVEPVWNRNNTLRGGYAIVNGAAEHHPEGVYYLRYKLGGKRRQWVPVGADSDCAIAALRNTEHDLQAIGLGRETGSLPAAPDDAPLKEQLSLNDEIELYLDEVRKLKKADKTLAASKNMLARFSVGVSGKMLRKITRDDLINYGFALGKDGLSERTVHNHLGRIRAFMKSRDVAWPLKTGDMPDYEQEEAKVYDQDQLARFFAVATSEDRLLFEFFLNTGLREQEVMHCTWADIDFKSNAVFVKAKPRFGFRVKNRKGRSVPVPDSLIESLAARKRQSDSILLFPGSNGRPDGHMLRRLQGIAHRAGLNCGECVTKGGVSCAGRPVCSEWGLHKFRKTFATMHHEAGVSPRSIQKWLDHADLATTLRYLAIADIRSERTRSQVNSTFANLSSRFAA
jgi:integrase/recombinase XerD